MRTIILFFVLFVLKANAVIIGAPPPINPYQYGASGSSETVTGSISANSNTLIVNGSWDIAPGQGVWIPHAGPASTTGTPTISVVTVAANLTDLIAFSGTPTAGETVSIEFASLGLTGSPVTVSYTQVASDSLASIAYNFQQLVNQNQNFRVAGIFATWDNYPIQNFNQVRVQQIATAPPLVLTLTNSAHVTLAQSQVGASATVAYSVMARDAAGGFSAPSAVMNALNSGDPTVSFNAPNALRFNRNPVMSNTNTVAWTADGNAIDVYICRNNALVGVVPAVEGLFIDEGMFTISGGNLDFPGCAAATSTPAPLIATAIAVNGEAVTLANSSQTAAANVTIAHDDGAALQAMLTAGCQRSSAGGALDGYMVIPIGNYNTHQSLVCIGDAGAGVIIQGQGGRNRIGIRSGSFISYWGRGDQAVLHTIGVNGSSFKDVLLYGNYIAKWALQIDNETFSVSGNHFDGLGLWRPNASTLSAGIAIGNPGCTQQLSEQFFENIYIFQDVGSHAGVYSFCGGNQKNMHFFNWTVVGFHIGVGGITTGTWSFINGVAGNVEDTIFSGINNLIVIGLEAEGAQGSRLTQLSVTAFSGSFQTFNGVTLATPQGGPTFNMCDVSGATFDISNSYFGAGTNQGEYYCNTLPTSGVFTTSKNNFWENSPTIPIYTGGNRVSGQSNIALISVGDYGSALVGQGTGTVAVNIGFGQLGGGANCSGPLSSQAVVKSGIVIAC